MSSLLLDKLSALTIAEIRGAARGVVHLPDKVTKKKDIIQYIVDQSDEQILHVFQTIANDKQMLKEQRQVEMLANRKRKLVENQNTRRVARKIAHDENITRDLDEFLKLPSPEDVLQCYGDFY